MFRFCTEFVLEIANRLRQYSDLTDLQSLMTSHFLEFDVFSPVMILAFSWLHRF